MVWQVGYKPTKKFPGIDFGKGNFSEVRVIDLDVGEPDLYQIAEASFRYGRRVSAPNVPTEGKWDSTTAPDDYFIAYGIPFISEKLRIAIEAIEPNIHQFLPLMLSSRNENSGSQYWYWVVCNRFDTVDRENTNLVLYRKLKWIRREVAERTPPPWTEQMKLAFTSRNVGKAQFWRDAYMREDHLFISKDAVSIIDAQGFSGIFFAEREVVK